MCNTTAISGVINFHIKNASRSLRGLYFVVSPKRPKTGLTEIIMATELACQQNDLCDNSEDSGLWWRFGKGLGSVENVLSGTKKTLRVVKLSCQCEYGTGFNYQDHGGTSKTNIYTLFIFSQASSMASGFVSGTFKHTEISQQLTDGLPWNTIQCYDCDETPAKRMKLPLLPVV